MLDLIDFPFERQRKKTVSANKNTAYASFEAKSNKR